ncbi:hypothetical protein HYS54_01110 [Candidatus Micrarchaeota archaeon]|nr:hypothetical protein [Candidatus Micrarchaeota archaeon]
MTDTTQAELKRIITQEEKTVKHAKEEKPAEAEKAPQTKEAAEKAPAQVRKRTKKEEVEKPLEEKVVIVSLAKAWHAPRNKRTTIAMRELRQKLEKGFHKRAVVSGDVNKLAWSRGMHYPPRKLKLKASVFKDRVVIGPAS